MSELKAFIEQSRAVWEQWNEIGVKSRVAVLEKWGNHLRHRGSQFSEAADMVQFQCAQANKLIAETELMPGPTGETNELYCSGRGTFLVQGGGCTALAGQLAAALVAGNTVVLCDETQHAGVLVADLAKAGCPDRVVQQCANVSEHELATVPGIDGVAFCGGEQVSRAKDVALSHREGALIQVVAENDPANLSSMGSPVYLLRFVTECTRTINITAVGGNATLLELGSG
ncbi:aldehyde dehydrogenase family protein [Parasalinivibrio latis]|uniref:aldehyde dehydrogenase family protein n=1 Tax=Parasalinivibrio latis TaxID=2952610 RepID=UPI0030E36808